VLAISVVARTLTTSINQHGLMFEFQENRLGLAHVDVVNLSSWFTIALNAYEQDYRKEHR
jgi:hypothetical protein